jgi:heptosyltransferase-2
MASFPAPGKIIVRLPNWIGDAVMAIPAVKCIKSHRPGIEVTSLGKRAVIELYKHSKAVDRLIEFDLPAERNRLSALKSFSRSLRKYNFDCGLVLPDSFSSALVFKLGGVKRRLGYRSELRSFLLTEPLRQPEGVIHRGEKYMNLVKSALDIDDCRIDVSVDVSDKEREAADRFLSDTGKFVVICPTSRAESRRWGDTKYCELIARVSGELGMDVVLAGSGDEAGFIDNIADRSESEVLNLASENDLLLSVEVMRRAEAFVGNDSGAAHLAAASGTRVVSISGADDPSETKPLARVGEIVNKHIHCSPCVKNVCPRKDHINECMDVISVDDVMDALRRILTRDR